MSRLKELRLHGFKSFADQTRFVFEPGVNAIIGPNGSGKSNMADAVRWVLGEQSNRWLRTRRSDDVIFAGSERRRPQGMAEAILTLDNHDRWLPIEFGEVSIGRRAYRSGESEYLVNGAKVRLRDVVDLLGEGRLGANELVVVGQGTVDAALSLRPDERRQLFEEAAGVKGLQVRRNEASVRLVKARDNLLRVGDLLAELKPQVRRLALQAEHQQQHDELGARARALALAWHARRERATRVALDDARRASAAAEAALDAFRAEQHARRQAVAAAEERYWKADEDAREAAGAREATREALIRAEGRAEAFEARLRDLRHAADRDGAELAAAESALRELHDPAPDGAGEAALAAAAAAEAAWRAALSDLAAADEALMAAEEAVATVRSRDSDRIAVAARESEDAARRAARREHLVAEERALGADEAAAGAAVERASRTYDSARRALEAAGADLERAEAERDHAQAEADSARQHAVSLAEQLRATRAERDAAEGPTDASTRLSRRLAAAGWRSLLDAMTTSDDAWAAVEAVVGGELEAALLWSESDPSAELPSARGAARLLSTAGDARDDRGRAQALRAVGAERTLDELLSTGAVPTAVRRTVVAPQLAALLAGWRALPPGWSAVTLDGDLADARGLLVLRGRADPPGAAARAHLRRRELADAVIRLESDAVEAQDAAHSATERLRLTREQHLAAAEGHDEATRRLRHARDEREAAQSRMMRTTARLGEVRANLAGSLDADAPGPAAHEMAGDELARLQDAAAAARERRDRLAAERDAARERWSAARAAAEHAERRTSGARHERMALDARIDQLRSSLQRAEAAADSLGPERHALDGALADARDADAAAARAQRLADEARAARRAELLELERGGDPSSRLAELERAAQGAAVQASLREEALAALDRELQMALDGLPEAVETVPSDGVEALEDAALEAELRRVRRTLAQIGSVNPFAVDEHREQAARLADMTAQHDDLSAAIASTEELIATLDRDIRQQFDAAFRAIAGRFDEYCGLLFAGGSGSLTVGEEGDGDAPGGIEIVVRPPGKRLQRLAMLSGGERALTGVALLFAMLTVNPVPFCILDEVDAALDEANIGRFADALRRLSESIDFVVITHNRATIEIADTIYGVTMTDTAVSRVLSLRLADVPLEAAVS